MAEHTTSKSGGRAGRNLPAATAVGIGLLALVTFSLIYVPLLFVATATFASFMAVRELSNALKMRGRHVVTEVALPASLLLPGLAYFFGPEYSLGAVALLLIAAAWYRLRSGVEGYFNDFASTVLVIAYVPLLIGFATAMSGEELGAEMVISMILLTAGNDTGGYFAGIFFGKHPMAPNISPKKSWEGMVGSLLTQALLGAFVVPLLLPIAAWQGLLLGLVMSVTATIGDLAESAIKRDLGVKDMSQALPGHGGFMDRLDSLLINAVVAWVAFAWMGL